MKLSKSFLLAILLRQGFVQWTVLSNIWLPQNICVKHNKESQTNYSFLMSNLSLVGFILLSKKQALIPQYLKLTPWEELLLQQQPMLWFLSKKFWIWQTGPRLQLFVRFITNLFLPPLLERLYFRSLFTTLLLCYNMMNLNLLNSSQYT